MPKRSRSRTRKRTRQSGGDHDKKGNLEGHPEDHTELHKSNTHDEKQPTRKPDHVSGVTEGGKRGKTSRKGKKRMKKSRKGKKMNEFFKLLIKAKKSGAPSFVYKGNTYKKKVGTKKNPKLIIYKKA